MEKRHLALRVLDWNVIVPENMFVISINIFSRFVDVNEIWLEALVIVIKGKGR